MLLTLEADLSFGKQCAISLRLWEESERYFFWQGHRVSESAAHEAFAARMARNSDVSCGFFDAVSRS